MKKKLAFTYEYFRKLILENSKDGKTDYDKITKLLGFKTVRVVYNDGSRRDWDLSEWFFRRDRILTNLFNKKLCKIKFLIK
jgi:hypothetical protein